QALETDRGCLQKMKKYVKTMCTSGQTYVENEELFSNYLEKFGNNYLEREEPHLATAFLKFSVYTKELSSHLKSMNRQVNNVIVFSLDTLLKGDLKEVKGDLKKSFDKTWKDYETKIHTPRSKTEKEEDMERERKAVQLQMCEYLIKVNEIQSKKGADFLQHLIKLYHTHSSFFQDSLKIVESLKGSVEDLTAELTNIKQAQDDERKKLCAMKDKLKDSLQVESKEDAGKLQAVYSLHQLQGNKTHGNEKSGHLLKKSDGIRKVWQKRKCDVRNGFLLIYHGVANRQPAKLNLLTCQVKPSAEDRKCFSLISYNRTYHFQVEDERECTVWFLFLSRSNYVLLFACFKYESRIPVMLSPTFSYLNCKPIWQRDHNCAYCPTDPSWLATNLGILTCIECSGIHREMGVHVSRIQSITLDVLSTAELLLARNVGNYRFNEILESNLPTDCDIKPTADSDMNERRSYITAKYIERKFTKRSAQSSADKAAALCAALVAKDIFALIEVYSEGVDLLEPLDAAQQEKGETALHFAVRQSDRSSLHLVDFLILNCRNVNKQTENGNTALHFCSRYNATECLKLLLRSKAALHVSNEAGETALDIAKQMDHAQCEDLLTLAEKGLFNPRTPVEYNWKLDKDDLCESEDELDEKVTELSCQQIRAAQSFVFDAWINSQSCLSCPSISLPKNVLRMQYQVFKHHLFCTSSTITPVNPTEEFPPQVKRCIAQIGIGHLSNAPSSLGLADGAGGRRKPPPPPPNRPLHKRTHSEPFGPSQLRNSTPPPIPPLPHISPVLSSKWGGEERQEIIPTNKESSGRIARKVKKNEIGTVILSLFKKTTLPEISQQHVENAALARRPSTQRPRPAPPSPPDKLALALQLNYRPPSPSSIFTKIPRLLTSPPPPPASCLPSSVNLEKLSASSGSGPSSSSSVSKKFQVWTFSISVESGLVDGSKVSREPISRPRPHPPLPPKPQEMPHRPPVPLPRKPPLMKPKIKRVKAKYDCQADQKDELTFMKGDIIVVEREDDDEWWSGYVEGVPARRGAFPVSFIEQLTD
uniref:ArfGAP with SH3 domain, ankyrin repeat and PH domain 2a n=1 Tax=Petromyzon marinus TaxID=7757 RepID=S4RQH9_PETMA